MAKKKLTKEIVVKEPSMTAVRGIFATREDGAGLTVAPGAHLEDKIAARAKLDEKISALGQMRDMLSADIESISLEDAIKDLIARGLLSSDYETPVIVIDAGVSKDGTKLPDLAITLTAKESTGFSVDSCVKSSNEEIWRIVPDKYKERKETLNKKALEKDYFDGTLAEDSPVLKGYCSDSPTSGISTRTTTRK